MSYLRKIKSIINKIQVSSWTVIPCRVVFSATNIYYYYFYSVVNTVATINVSNGVDVVGVAAAAPVLVLMTLVAVHPNRVILILFPLSLSEISPKFRTIVMYGAD
jgi:hypothetical protein